MFSRTVLLALTLLTFARSAGAATYLTSDFELSYGMATLGVTASTSYARTLQTFTLVDFTYNLKAPSNDISFSLSFTEVVQSTLGILPFNRLGLGLRWYPIGMNGARILFDNDTEGRLWGPAPYISGTFGVTNLSVDDGDIFFNAVLFDIHPVIGLETPITSNFIVCPQIGYVFSLLGGSGSTAVGYSGLTLMVGLKYHSL